MTKIFKYLNSLDKRYGDLSPRRALKQMKLLLSRLLNKNQILILSALKYPQPSISFLLRDLSNRFNIPLSTLKYNAKILKNLELISYGNNKKIEAPKLTELGKIVTVILEVENNE